MDPDADFEDFDDEEKPSLLDRLYEEKTMEFLSPDTAFDVLRDINRWMKKKKHWWET